MASIEAWSQIFYFSILVNVVDDVRTSINCSYCKCSLVFFMTEKMSLQPQWAERKEKSRKFDNLQKFSRGVIHPMTYNSRIALSLKQCTNWNLNSDLKKWCYQPYLAGITLTFKPHFIYALSSKLQRTTLPFELCITTNAVKPRKIQIIFRKLHL